MAPHSEQVDGMQQSDNTHNPSTLPSSVSATVPPSPSQMTFQVAGKQLPTELFLRVLKEWIGRQRVEVSSSGHSDYALSYVNPENTDAYSTISKTAQAAPWILKEYFRSRVHSWLTDTKEFEDPPTFYLSHFLMSSKMINRPLPPYMLPSGHPWATLLYDCNLTLSTAFPILTSDTSQYGLSPRFSSLHGFEKIKLDFTAEKYFALFDVSVPPFHYADTAITGDNLYRDDFCHGAGLFLTNTKDLEIHFGDKYKAANPWYDVQEPAWCEENPTWEYKESRLRPRVCESGLVVDWVLGYAWYAGWLQHIKKIQITGDVQEWVKRKWEGIFERHNQYAEKFAVDHPGEMPHILAVYSPDPVELETVGMVDDEELESDNEDEDEGWMPRNHYPPTCTCEIGCWRLRGGKVEKEVEVEVRSWDEFEQYEVEVVGDWMVGVKLGPLA